MSKRPDIENVSAGYQSNDTLNSNFESLQEGFDNTLSRDGSEPNEMNADLDMDSNDILNVKNLGVQGDFTYKGTLLESLLDPPMSGEDGYVYTVAYTYSGNGATTVFTLAFDPLSANNTQVYINGVYQQKNAYTITGTALTFSEAPPAGTDNIEVILHQSVEGATGPQGPQGEKGDTGDTGPAGADGVAGATGATGPQGDIGPPGATGATGPKGDTGDQGLQGDPGVAGADGAGVVAGGTAGQALVKIDGTDYNTQWVDVDEVPDGGSAGQVLKKNSGTDQDLIWATEGSVAPTAFSSRTAFLSYISGSGSGEWDDGDVVHADGLLYSKSTAAGVITGLTDWTPFGHVYPDHFAENATPGSTDMTAAITSAVSWASSNGEVVHFLGHSYATDGVTLLDGVSLQGTLGTVLKLNTGAEANVILADTLTTPFSIKDLRVDGNRTNQTISDGTTVGVRVVDCENALLSNLHVDACAFDCIRVERGSNNKVVHCTATNGGVDATNRRAPGIRTTAAHNCIIEGNICNSNTTDGIDIDAATFYSVVVGNHCDDNDRNGIFIEESSQFITCTGNLCRRNDKGINVNQQDNSGTLSNITITGNTCDTNREAGVRVSANNTGKVVKRIVITGNTITNNDTSATGNGSITLNAQAAATLDDVVIVGNTSINSNAYGIYIGSSLVSNVYIAGNDLTGNTSGEIQNNGSTTVRVAPVSHLGSGYAGKLSEAEIKFAVDGSDDMDMHLECATGDARLRLQRDSSTGYEVVNEAGVFKLKRGTSGSSDTQTFLNVNGDRLLFNDPGTGSKLIELDPDEGSNGIFSTDLPLKLPSYSLATDPNATTSGAGTMVYVTDGDNGEPTLEFSDGTFWRQIHPGEELSYTPSITIGGGTTGISYSTQLGTAYRYGDLVLFNGYVALSSKGSGTGAVKFEIPLAAKSGHSTALTLRMAGIVAAFEDKTQMCRTDGNVWARLDKYNGAGGSTFILDTDIQNSTTFMVSGVYTIA